MQPKKAFNEILKRCTLALRTHDFSRRGQTLYRTVSGNWGLIAFQKSKWNTADSIEFTVNLGIFSARLADFFSATETRSRPSVWDCHWRQRLGHLSSERRDIWWPINVNTSLEDLGQEIQGIIIKLAVPELERYVRDEALRDLWLSGISPGLTDFQRLMNVSVLLKVLGPEDALPSVLEDLRRVSAGRPSAAMAEVHIQRLAEVFEE
jgi:hypothetical protein